MANICENCSESCILWQKIGKELLDFNFKRATSVKYKRKEMLFKQGSYNTSIFLLKSGFVKIFYERRNDKNVILKIASPNDFINISCLGLPINNYSAVSVCESEVCIFPIEEIINLATLNQTFSQFLIEEQSQINQFFIQKIVSFGTKQMHGRLADVILYLCSKQFDNGKIFEYLSRQDIAEMAGMSLEGSIRLLTEFKNDGLIRQEGKRIHINNEELILRLSEIG